MRIKTFKSILFVCTIIFLAACSGEVTHKNDFDVIISNGVVYDGSGEEPALIDIGIKGALISQMGDLSEFTANENIDASGLAVAPGLINMLSWATQPLIVDGRALSDIKQGVTLEVMGEGRSMGPLNDKMKANEKRRQSNIKFDIEWTTLNEYLEYIVNKGVSVNVASYVGATQPFPASRV